MATTTPLLTGTTNGHTWAVTGKVFDGKGYGYSGEIDGRWCWFDHHDDGDEILTAVRAHLEPQRVAEEKAIADLRARRADRAAECEHTGTPVRVRFGYARPGTTSTNHRDGTAEAGLSVYAGWRLPDGQVVLDLRGLDTTSYLFGAFTSRPAYLATGQDAGRGADGEPLLTRHRLRKLGVLEDVEYVA